MSNQEELTTQDGQEQEEFKPLTDTELEDMDYDTAIEKLKEANQKAQTYYGKFKHWRTKANQPKEPVVSKKEEELNPNFATKEDLEIQSLESKGYDEEEIKFIMENGGKKALNNPIIKAGLEKWREDRKAEQATQINSTGSGTADKKMSLDKLSSLSSDEMEKALRAGKVKDE